MNELMNLMDRIGATLAVGLAFAPLAAIAARFLMH